MNNTESRRPSSMQLDGHITPENNAPFVEKLNEMDQDVKKMLHLIEESGNLHGEKAQLYYQKKSELIAYAAEFNHMYRSLAESYGEMTGNIFPELKGCGSSKSVSEHASSWLTPSLKPGQQKAAEAVDYDLFLSSGGGSSDLSLKEGSEFSSSSSDFDSHESFNPKNDSSAPMNSDGKSLPQAQVVEEDEEHFIFKPRQNLNYEELLGRVAVYEEKLRVSNQKIEISEEEIAKLKGKLKESEFFSVHVGHLQEQVESTRSVDAQDIDLEMERRQVVALQNRIVELETRISDSSHEKQELISELETNRERLLNSDKEVAKWKHDCTDVISKDARQFQGQLDFAWNNIDMLENELDSERRQVSDLQKRITECTADISSRDCEIKELKFAVNETKERSFLEKAQLQSAVASLLEQQNNLEAKLESTEKEIMRYQAQNIEMEHFREVLETGLHCQIDRLKEENAERGELAQVLNKNLDIQKLKYDKLMAEKDDFVAQVLKLVSELSSRDIQIQQMEEQLRVLHTEHEDLNAGYDSMRSLVHELRSRVEELEKEVDRQGAEICDGEEKKREAIRQLCFSLEHYRSRYQELRQAFVGHKRRPVFAS